MGRLRPISIGDPMQTDCVASVPAQTFLPPFKREGEDFCYQRRGTAG
jgi:hypothetical protein